MFEVKIKVPISCAVTVIESMTFYLFVFSNNVKHKIVWRPVCGYSVC